MKTFVITLSKTFPSFHKRKGEQTNFKETFLAGQKKSDFSKTSYVFPKLHTIRANYELWAKRFEEIEKGNAQLSIRQWSGTPYRSEQIEIARLTRKDGIGIQQLSFSFGEISKMRIQNATEPSLETLAKNDGLSLQDWFEWFKGYDLYNSMAIIHFTKYRY